MDDVNNMDKSMDTVEQPAGVVGRALQTGLDRRTMLKAAVAAGTIAGTWVAPRIESFGFAPAGAATPCVILSPETDDKNSQLGSNYCPTPGPTCCGLSFGNAGQIDRFTFANPAPNCTQIVVRTISLDCSAANTTPQRNPDVGQFGVIIESATGAGCGVCTILDAVLIDAAMRTVIQSFNNGPLACPPAGPIGDGINASIPCGNPNIGPSSRLAVRLTCTVSGTC